MPNLHIRKRFWKNLDRTVARTMPLTLRERYRFRRWLGYWPNLSNPRTFNEHVKSRLLYRRDPRFVTIADKWEVRQWVAERIGPEHLISAKALIEDHHHMPAVRPPFVAKPTHMSGRVFVAPDDGGIDELRPIAAKWMATPYGADKGEWFYGQMKRRVIIEERLTDETWGEPLDYKFFCWNGRLEILQIDFTRATNHRQWFITRDGQRLRLAFRNYPQYDAPFTLPANFDEMVRVAETLAHGFDFMRVDLYNVDESRILFGEMTPSPWAGVAIFNPPKWDEYFGGFFGPRPDVPGSAEVQGHVSAGYTVP